MNKKKKTILCDAKAFCFGPISKLLTVSERLHEKYNIIFLVSRTSKMLSIHAHADQIIECDTENIEELKDQAEVFKKADLFINIMNPISAKFAAEIGLPIVEIDSLFWMWENISEDLLNSKIYFIQDFEGVKEQLEKFSKKMFNPVLVGPIVKNVPLGIERKNKLLVNLGGMESSIIKVGINTDYPFVIIKLLNDLLAKFNGFDEIVCAGNEDIINEMKKRMPNGPIEFKFFEHDEFLSQIAESKMIISTPGLTTAFEAFNSKTPIFFLPPQNYSQYWNLESFILKGVADGSINWNQLYPQCNIIKNEEQKVGIEKVLECTHAFESDKNACAVVTNYINMVISLDKKTLNDVAVEQKNYFDSLGGNGTDVIVEKINKLLEV